MGWHSDWTWLIGYPAILRRQCTSSRRREVGCFSRGSILVYFGQSIFSCRKVAFSSLQGIPFNWCQVLTLVGQGYQTSRCLFLWFCGWNAAWLKRTVWGYLFCLCTVPASFTDTLPRLRSWRFGRDEEAQFCLFCSINCMSAIVI